MGLKHRSYLSRGQVFALFVVCAMTLLVLSSHMSVSAYKYKRAGRTVKGVVQGDEVTPSKVDPTGHPLPDKETHLNWEVQVKAPFPAERTYTCGNPDADAKLAASFAIVEQLVTVDHRFAGLADAKTALQEAITLAPGCITPLINLGILHFAEFEDDKAIEAFDRALALTGEVPPLLKSKAKLWKAIMSEVRGIIPSAEYTAVMQEQPSWSMEYFGLQPTPGQAYGSLVFNARQTPVGQKIQLDGMRGLLLAKEYLVYFGGYPVVTRPEAQLWPEHWYIFIRNMLPPYPLRIVQQVYRGLIAAGALKFKDPQSTRYIEYNDPVARFLQAQFANMVQRITDEPVKPTYTYFGGYVGSSVLPPHTDRLQCEFTATLNIDTNPLDSVCPIGLTPKAKDISEDSRGNPNEQMPPPEEQLYVYPKPGDALLFKGRHLIHWRNEMPAGTNCSQIFLHYVKDQFQLSLN